MRTYCKMMFEISGFSGYFGLLWLFWGSVFPDILFGTVTMTNPVLRVIVLQNPGHLSLPTRLWWQPRKIRCFQSLELGDFWRLGRLGPTFFMAMVWSFSSAARCSRELWISLPCTAAAAAKTTGTSVPWSNPSQVSALLDLVRAQGAPEHLVLTAAPEHPSTATQCRILRRRPKFQGHCRQDLWNIPPPACCRRLAIQCNQLGQNYQKLGLFLEMDQILWPLGLKLWTDIHMF